MSDETELPDAGALGVSGSGRSEYQPPTVQLLGTLATLTRGQGTKGTDVATVSAAI